VKITEIIVIVGGIMLACLIVLIACLLGDLILSLPSLRTS